MLYAACICASEMEAERRERRSVGKREGEREGEREGGREGEKDVRESEGRLERAQSKRCDVHAYSFRAVRACEHNATRAHTLAHTVPVGG